VALEKCALFAFEGVGACLGATVRRALDPGILGRVWMRSVLRFSHPGTHEALALPALKRLIRVETLSRRAKALLPPHKCGGSHHQFGQVCQPWRPNGRLKCEREWAKIRS
jgi:hypothetical protein